MGVEIATGAETAPRTAGAVGSHVQGPPPRRRRRLTVPFTSYAYIAPAVAIVAGFFYFAIGFNIDASLYDWNGVSKNREWLGLENYRMLLEDPIARDALWHTVLWGLITVPAMALVGFTLACLLTARVKLKPVYRLIFFVPYLLAPAVVAPMAVRLLDPAGPVNDVLSALTGSTVDTAWLSEPGTALYALMVVHIWEWSGFSFILYMAALGAIDTDVFQAARVDGARTRTIMWRIAWPLCRPTHFTLAILGAISTFKQFEIVALTTGGGPGAATELLSTYIYNQSIEQFNAGYAASMSVVLLLIALLVTAVQLVVYRSRPAF